MDELTQRPGVAGGLRRLAQIFATFLRLGCTSFGGPIAHLGYFRTEFVVRRHWLTEQQFAELVSIAQLLPGPSSSQCGFGVGLLRGGWGGGIAAFVGFTLPSLSLMMGYAAAAGAIAGNRFAPSLFHGLQLVAVPVVAQAVYGMARQLTPDLKRSVIAAVCAAACLTFPERSVQLATVACGAIAGCICCRDVPVPSGGLLRTGGGSRTAALALALFVLLMVMAIVASASESPLAQLTASLYQTGALVFGGGHVVLPLLQRSLTFIPTLGTGDFLAAYGVAQALPGPMFSLAAYLGVAAGGPAVAVLAVFAIFLPGLLLMAALMPAWSFVARKPQARAALSGVNAAVVGVLVAAFWDPVLTTTVLDGVDALIAAICLVALLSARVPVLLVILGCVSAVMARSVLQG